MKTIEKKQDPIDDFINFISNGLLLSAVLMLLALLTLRCTAQPVDPGHAPLSTAAIHTSKAKREKVRQIYNSQIGVRETQPNSGPEVEKYLRYANLPKGNPWCAAFVCWAYGKAGVSNPRTGWSADLFKSSRVIWERGAVREFGEPGTRNQESRLVHRGDEEQRTRSKEQRFLHSALQRASGIPSTGDVFGIYFPDKGRIAHVGFVDEWNDPWVLTVEGNTNILASREGDGVYRKRRLVRSINKVARYIN